jgi:large subunit ribosomal protein L28
MESPRDAGFLGVTKMKQCALTGKVKSRGNKYVRRGKAKYLGGNGRKVTGITKRTFEPNLQKVQALVDGKVCRIWVSTKAMRSGLLVKPVKRKPFEMPTV